MRDPSRDESMGAPLIGELGVSPSHGRFQPCRVTSKANLDEDADDANEDASQLVMKK